MADDDDLDLEVYEPGDARFPHRSPADINPHELPTALRSLTLFGRSYMIMQANNLTIVDQFAMSIEERVRARLFEEERTPGDDAMFLNAQSQMWIFALYELLRTWQQKAKNIVKWHPNKMLPQMIERLRQPDGDFIHPGKAARAQELQDALDDPNLVEALKVDLRRIHMPFAQIEMLRMTLAKHEEKGVKNSVAIAPGYGRIDRLTGSLSYELGAGKVIFGYITRRQIADLIRALPEMQVPDDAAIQSFDQFMRADFPDPPETINQDSE
jgi:hypothetical protein